MSEVEETKEEDTFVQDECHKARIREGLREKSAGLGSKKYK